MKTSLDQPTEGNAVPPTTRTIVSLLVFAHLFFVWIGVSANFERTALHNRLLDRFSFYTRLFNFDLDFTPYHLTHASRTDVDHRLEVMPKDRDGQIATDWLVLPAGGFRGFDGYKRFQRFGATWAMHTQLDGADPALFAKTLATHFARERQVIPKQVRVRLHLQQAPEDLAGGSAAQRDPNDPSQFAVAYAANAIVSDSGSVDIVRIEDASQTAAPTGNSSNSRGTTGNERRR